MIRDFQKLKTLDDYEVLDDLRNRQTSLTRSEVDWLIADGTPVWQVIQFSPNWGISIEGWYGNYAAAESRAKERAAGTKGVTFGVTKLNTIYRIKPPKPVEDTVETIPLSR